MATLSFHGALGILIGADLSKFLALFAGSAVRNNHRLQFIVRHMASFDP